MLCYAMICYEHPARLLRMVSASSPLSSEHSSCLKHVYLFYCFMFRVMFLG